MRISAKLAIVGGRIRIVTSLLLPGALLLVAAVALMVGQEVATRRAVDATTMQAREAATLLASSFRRELEKFRLVAVVLAQDREARDALVTRDPGRLSALNAKLEDLSRETQAAVVYLLDAQGRTLAGSNYRRPDSFVGRSYAFRAYFRDAMRAGAAQQFALGTSSRRPGLYLAKRIDDAGGHPLGVFVVKVEFDPLEAEWRAAGNPAFATYRRGIILVTSEPGWRFQTTEPLSETVRDRIRRDLEFGTAPLIPNRLYASAGIAPAGSRDAYARPYVEAVAPAADGWSVHVVGSTARPVAQAVTTMRLSLLIIFLLGGALYLFWRHRQRLARARTEAEVDERIVALRRRLTQANKLATLGQVVAGVGHEINQPVTAIGTYAHSARALIARGDAEAATEAVDRIAALTGRIGIITRELHGFARRADGVLGPVAVDAAIEGALLLLRDRIRTLGVEIDEAGVRGAFAIAERVRLEQVLVNLLANAMDAGADRIGITVVDEPPQILILVADDGPGLSEEARDGLFQPFTTTKADGLGLGLVISHDIVAEFGGTLTAESPPAGALFRVALRRA